MSLSHEFCTHDIMHPLAMGFERFQTWVRTLTDITAMGFRLLVSQEMLLQTVHGAKPTETNWAAHGLDVRFAGPAPLMKQKTDHVGEFGAAAGAAIRFGCILRAPTFATVPR